MTQEEKAKAYDKALEQAKNLYPLYWKPSKAQMIALSLAIEGRCPPTNYYFQDLKDLYNKLLYFY